MDGGRTDLELFEKWREGDRAAGNELFERHFDSVYRFFAHKSPDDAVDLVQRTFLGCVEARDRFRGASSFRTYLFAIARNQLLAHWRNRAPNADPATSSVRDLEPTPSAILAERGEQRVMLEALRGLPLDLQIALELHYWENLGTKDIAVVLDVPEGTAKSRLRRAREGLLAGIRAIERDSARLESTLGNLDAWAASLKDAVVAERPRS